MPSECGVDDQVRKATQGDGAALESVLLFFHDPLLEFIRHSLCKNSTTGPAADDVFQETLIEAFRQSARIQARGSDSFFAWLKSIARTRHLNLIRASKALKRGRGKINARARRSPDRDAAATSILHLLEADQSTPSRIVRREETFRAIRTALAGLEPAKRQAVELRYGQGLTIQEVAARFGKKSGAVKMLIHRAVRDLRDAVAHDFSAGV